MSTPHKLSVFFVNAILCTALVRTDLNNYFEWLYDELFSDDNKSILLHKMYTDNRKLYQNFISTVLSHEKIYSVGLGIAGIDI